MNAENESVMQLTFDGTPEKGNNVQGTIYKMCDMGSVVQGMMDQISKKIKSLKTLNIIVAGKTGVGKSTLINAVFKEKLAETGIGSPVTTHMQKLTKKDLPLAIYDTRVFGYNTAPPTAYVTPWEGLLSLCISADITAACSLQCRILCRLRRRRRCRCNPFR